MQTFRLGDTVRIKSGPFNNFNARVEGINQSNSRSLIRARYFLY